MNTIHAKIKEKRGKIVDVEIPTDEEIERIAMRMHKSGKPCLETMLGWNVFYRPRENNPYTTTSFNPFTGERGEESARSKSVIPAEFTFGKNDPWSIVLRWGEGDDKPPTWFRYEDKLIRPTKQEHTENRNLCEPVQDIPPGVARRNWILRDDYHHHHHSRMHLSNEPLYLELHWRQTTGAPVRRVGAFRLNLAGLLRDGYIRPERADAQDSDVRLRIVRADDGSFYVETKKHGPRLLLANRDHALVTPLATDIANAPADRVKTTAYRILRDTELARSVKVLHDHQCQICGHCIELPDGSRYAEAHHIQPLGKPHNGPYVIGNILCVCPNHHAELDYRVTTLMLSALRHTADHPVEQKYVDYHNRLLEKPVDL